MGLKEAIDRVGGKLFGRREEPVSPPIEFAIRCHKGNVRVENQDRAASFETPLGALFMVADGVGGLTSGAKAAEMAVEGYGRFLTTVNRNLDPKAALEMATQAVNEAVCNQYATTQQAMGSTVVLALLRHKTALIGHAGDSRAYLIRNNAMSRLTRDHSIVQKMVDHGIISDAQSRSHPDASVLTRSLGQKELKLEVSETELTEGDALLLCSDGLWGYVEESDIHGVATASSLNAEKRCEALLDLALKAGGADNISIVFLVISWTQV